MEQHPVPQNVTSYQFRLVGDMTLKQFAELAGGILLAILLSKTKAIPFFIKWPAAGISAFSGIALAFLPFEERPLDQWLINFIKAIYSPTQYVWHKKGQIPNFLAFEPTKTTQITTPSGKSKDKEQLRVFMQTLSSQQGPSLAEDREKKALAYISNLFGPISHVPISISTISYKPAGFAPRKLKPKEEIIKKEEVIFKQKEQRPNSSTYIKAALSSSTPVVKIEPAQPLAPPIQVGSLYPPKPPKPSPLKKRVGPQFASDLPMPVPPDLPNLLTGMVVSLDDRLIPNAILEIRDTEGNPVRALKTNKLGQFFIATPLHKGRYEVEVDHPNYQFDIIKIAVADQIIPPIKIKATKEITDNNQKAKSEN